MEFCGVRPERNFNLCFNRCHKPGESFLVCRFKMTFPFSRLIDRVCRAFFEVKLMSILIQMI